MRKRDLAAAGEKKRPGGAFGGGALNMIGETLTNRRYIIGEPLAADLGLQLRAGHTVRMTGVSSPSCSSSTSGSDPTASDHPSAPSVCDAPDQPCPHRLEAISLRQQAHYYKAMHQRALQRERHLQQEVALLQAELRDLRHRLFGRTSEAHHTPDCLDLDVPPTENAAPRPAGSEATEPAPAAPAAQRPRRPRGQRRGG